MDSRPKSLACSLSLLSLFICNGVRVDDDALDRHRSHRLVLCSNWLLLHLVKSVQTVDESAKCCVDTVQVGLSAVREEELRAVSVWPSVHHGEATSPLVLQGGHKFVLEVTAVDTLTTFSSSGGIATLDHESFDVSVKSCVVIISRCGEGQEILACLWSL